MVGPGANAAGVNGALAHYNAIAMKVAARAYVVACCAATEGGIVGLKTTTVLQGGH